MSFYNANEIIRLTRIAKGISQEELCFDICAPATLSGIENGKHRVKRETYRQLMRKMGRMTEKQYAVCIGKDGCLLQYREEMERAFKRYDYDAAEEYVLQMKEQAHDNVLTQQYLVRAEAMVEYYQKRIDATEAIRRVDAAIRMTAPDYEVYIGRKDKILPFVKEELLAIMTLGQLYCALKEYEKSERYYRTVLRCLDKNYLGFPENMKIRAMVYNEMAGVLMRQKRYKEALDLLNKGIEISVTSYYGPFMPILLGNKAYCDVELVRMNELEETYLAKAKECLQQAYYVASARREDKLAASFARYYARYLGEETDN